MKLKRITKKGFVLTNICNDQTMNGRPMVGSTWCKTKCPYYRGELNMFFIKFIKCLWNHKTKG